MPAPTEIDLIDLKFLPSWVREEEGGSPYADYEGVEPSRFEHSGDQRRRERGPRRDRPPRRPGPESRGSRPAAGRDRDERRGREPRPVATERQAAPALPKLEIHFLPHTAALESVTAQMKSGTAAYSVYALARLFLQKPERYDVRVNAPADSSAFFRAGESSVISTDRTVLESSAFRSTRDDYYRSDVTLQEPIKGNFTSVARERTSGTLLGPTNHHAYQPLMRRLFEQRFSRRMNFGDFQRQIEIVTDPALVEQWKEEARKATTYTTLHEDPPQTFASEAEAERHFRENHLPGLITESREVQIDGVTSRSLRDRGIARVIENAWSEEVRSPAHIMQELAGRLRGAGLHIFRHRRGMLFVSPVRPKAIDESSASATVAKILETIRSNPRLSRKELAERLLTSDAASEDAEKLKLALASDLRWLVREGHVVEFNDGKLDLPRVKPPVAPLPHAVTEPTGNSALIAGVQESAAAEPPPVEDEPTPSTSSAEAAEVPAPVTSSAE
ncbi:MAG: winged helix-turn-helix domain-containing protein [Verrucomicrobiota bacterium]